MIPEELRELTVPINQLKPRAKNPRKGSLETVKESLEKNGQYRPIVVNKRNEEILAGNHTYQAAKELGWEEIAATYVDADEDQATRIVLVDNRANDLATYDDEMLLELLKELDDTTGTGFDNKDIAVLISELEDDPERNENDPDEVPDIDDEEVQAKQGDIWDLDGHRLICGSATDPQTLVDLVGDDKINLVLTDPPYGVDYISRADIIGVSHKTIANDAISVDSLFQFIRDSFHSVKNVVDKGTNIYCFYADSNRVQFETALKANDISVRQNLLWIKSYATLSRQDYNYQHEPILYGWVEGAAHEWFGGFNKTTVIDYAETDLKKLSKEDLLKHCQILQEEIQSNILRYPKPAKSDLHPTMKPVDLIEKLIQNSCEYNGIVLDIFGGSGTTMIAAETTGRKAFLVELDEKYCETIVKRWERYTGKKAVKREAK